MTVQSRRVTGQDRFQIQNVPELRGAVGLRRLGLFPGESSVVKGQIVPGELAGVVEDGGHVLDGGHRRQRELVTVDGVEEVELGPGVRGDEPPVGRDPDVPIGDRWARRVRKLERLAGGKAIELAASGCGVEEAGSLGTV